MELKNEAISFIIGAVPTPETLHLMGFVVGVNVKFKSTNVFLT